MKCINIYVVAYAQWWIQTEYKLQVWLAAVVIIENILYTCKFQLKNTITVCPR